jgi:FKBP-type peptidyl-prolyl cis-trans isomerase
LRQLAAISKLSAIQINNLSNHSGPQTYGPSVMPDHFIFSMFLLVAAAAALIANTVVLTDDGKVKKTVVRDGNGPKPTETQSALIHYTGFLEDGTVFDSSRGRSPFQFKIGLGVIRGWSIGVKSMSVGEISNFTVDYDYGYGERGYPPVIPAKAPLSFQIELLSVSNG